MAFFSFNEQNCHKKKKAKNRNEESEIKPTKLETFSFSVSPVKETTLSLIVRKTRKSNPSRAMGYRNTTQFGIGRHMKFAMLFSSAAKFLHSLTLPTCLRETQRTAHMFGWTRLKVKVKF